MTVKEIEKDNCQLFNTGRFTDITLAYLVCALRDAKIPTDMAGKIIDIFYHGMDEMTAEEALERYRGNVH